MSPQNLIFLKIFSSEICYIGLRFSDQNCEWLEKEDKLTLL